MKTLKAFKSFASINEYWITSSVIITLLESTSFWIFRAKTNSMKPLILPLNADIEKYSLEQPHKYLLNIYSYFLNFVEFKTDFVDGFYFGRKNGREMNASAMMHTFYFFVTKTKCLIFHKSLTKWSWKKLVVIINQINKLMAAFILFQVINTPHGKDFKILDWNSSAHLNLFHFTGM